MRRLEPPTLLHEADSFSLCSQERNVITSWNGPDRASFELDLCVALLLAAEATALALVCLRFISLFSPDMVLVGSLKLDIENRSCNC